MTAGGSAGDDLLAQIIADQMPGADDGAVAVVTAVTGLLARVAYADREYLPSEQDRMREELSMVLGFTEAHIAAVSAALLQHIDRIGEGPTANFSAILRERFDSHMHVDTVRVLIELAAVDGVIADAERVIVHQVANELNIDDGRVDALLSAFGPKR